MIKVVERRIRVDFCLKGVDFRLNIEIWRWNIKGDLLKKREFSPQITQIYRDY